MSTTTLISVPQSGIKSINGVTAPAGNVNIISSDNSITVVPNPSTRQIDITAASGSGVRTDIVEIVSISGLAVGDFAVVKNGIADKILLDGSYAPVLYGICIEKINPTLAVVQINGLTPTLLAGLTDGANYFADDNGIITTTVPTAGPGLTRYLVELGVAIGTNRLFLQNKQPVLRRG